MNAKPTRRQWRGYAVLGIVLSASLAAFFLWPVDRSTPVAADHSQLKEAIADYGDSILSWQRKEKAHTKEYPYRQRRSDWRKEAPAFRQENHQYGEKQYAQHEKRRYVVDINTADTSEMQLLYGIGPVFANRIFRYRQRLGGFVRKEQLLEVYGMDSVRYAGFVDDIVVDSNAVVRLDINNATVDELKRHPYLDYYQARSIVDYRKYGKRIENADDLLLVNLLDRETVRKLQGYIQFN